jgi:hypothetical protein
VREAVASGVAPTTRRRLRQSEADADMTSTQRRPVQNTQECIRCFIQSARSSVVYVATESRELELEWLERVPLQRPDRDVMRERLCDRRPPEAVRDIQPRGACVFIHRMPLVSCEFRLFACEYRWTEQMMHRPGNLHLQASQNLQ